MDDPRLAALLEGFDPALPLAEARTPPASWYTSPVVHDAERARVFAGSWQPLVRAHQVAEPGSYAAACFAGVPVLVARDGEGTLRAFRNTCRHRATTLAAGEGRAEELVCNYHGWRYRLDGALAKAPELGGVKGFDRADYGLRPLPVAVVEPYVWVGMGEAAADPEVATAAVATRLPPDAVAGLEFVERRSYRLACDWKVYVDNYLDGGYHVATLHQGLGAQLDLAAYRTELLDRGVAQTCVGNPGAATLEGDFAARVSGEALYLWNYPNFMVNRYGPWMDTNLVIPRGPGECEVVFDYFLDRAAAPADPDFVPRSLEASHTVQEQDVEICEKVQEGLASGSFDTGPYSVSREGGELHFHRLLAADLAS